MDPFPAQFISSLVCWDSHCLRALRAQIWSLLPLALCVSSFNWNFHLQWWMCCSFSSTFDLTCDYLDIISFLPVTSHFMSCFHSLISLSSASSQLSAGLSPSHQHRRTNNGLPLVKFAEFPSASPLYSSVTFHPNGSSLGFETHPVLGFLNLTSIPCPVCQTQVFSPPLHFFLYLSTNMETDSVIIKALFPRSISAQCKFTTALRVQSQEVRRTWGVQGLPSLCLVRV